MLGLTAGVFMAWKAVCVMALLAVACLTAVLSLRVWVACGYDCTLRLGSVQLPMIATVGLLVATGLILASLLIGLSWLLERGR